MSSESPLLVKFSRGSVPTGTVSKDGMPVYEPCIMIDLSRPPRLHLHRRATEEEIDMYGDAYKAFLKTEHAKSQDVQGYPLAMWPVINAGHLEVFAGRDIFTVEQLSKLAMRKDMPPDLLELAQRAKKFLELQAQTGKFEAMILDRDRRIEMLMEENAELKIAVNKLTAKIAVLADKVMV